VTRGRAEPADNGIYFNAEDAEDAEECRGEIGKCNPAAALVTEYQGATLSKGSQPARFRFAAIQDLCDNPGITVGISLGRNAYRFTPAISMPQNSMSQKFDEPILPRPGWLLVANSLRFMGIFLFAGGFWLAGFWHWDPFVWLCALIFVVPSFVFARWQYSATFHGNQWSAAKLFVFLLIVGSVLTLGAGGAVIEPLANGIVPPRGYLLHLVVPLALVAVWLFFTAVLTRRWRKRMAKSCAAATVPSDAAPPPLPADGRTSNRRILPSLSLRGLVGFVVALSAAVAGFAFGRHDSVPRRQMHVTARESCLSLPDGAADVCVLRGFRGTITFEFGIDEAGFWRWTEPGLGSLESEAANVPIKAIEGSFAVDSCSEDPNEYTVDHVIHRGWYYWWNREDRSVIYAYDSDTGRAYFHFNSY
jgi:hypothetical protein